MEDTTIIIKTLERPDILRCCLESLFAHYPAVPVLVADDSEQPQKNVKDIHANATCLPMPYDSGLSGGRNRLIDEVSTPYVVLMDDDYIVTDDTYLEAFVRDVKKREYDIVGGSLTLPGNKLQTYHAWMELIVPTLYLIKPRPEAASADTFPCNIVLNFFAARVDALRAVRWDDRLKVGEHEDFFWRAKQEGLKVGYCPRVNALHRRDHAAKGYSKMRNRSSEMRKIVREKHGWDRVQWAFM